MVALAKRGPVSLSGPHFWIRVAKCLGQRRIQIWKLSQVWAATHCCAPVILCRFGHDTRMVGGRCGLNWFSSVLMRMKNLLFPCRMLESGFLLALLRAVAVPKRRARARSPQPPTAPIFPTIAPTLPAGPLNLHHPAPSLTVHLLPSWLQKSESAVGCFNEAGVVGTASESPAGLRRSAQL